ncbi:unnamed protein product, partial [Mesorhabditis spiculigera]
MNGTTFLARSPNTRVWVDAPWQSLISDIVVVLDQMMDLLVIFKGLCMGDYPPRTCYSPLSLDVSRPAHRYLGQEASYSPLTASRPQATAQPAVVAEVKEKSEVRFASPICIESPIEEESDTETLHCEPRQSAPLKAKQAPVEFEKRLYRIKNKGSPKDLPSAHPKTIAFGATTNVSQTVEGKQLAVLQRGFARTKQPVVPKMSKSVGALPVSDKENKSPAAFTAAPNPFKPTAKTSAKSAAGLEAEVEELRKEVKLLKERDAERANQMAQLWSAIHELQRKARAGTSEEFSSDDEASPRCRRSGKRVKPWSEFVEEMRRKYEEDPLLFNNTFGEIIVDMKGPEPKPGRSSRDRRDSSRDRPRDRDLRPSSRPRHEAPLAAHHERHRGKKGATVTQKFVYTQEVQHGLSPRLDELYSVDTKQYFLKNHVLSTEKPYPEELASIAPAPQFSAYPRSNFDNAAPKKPMTPSRRRISYMVDMPEEEEEFPQADRMAEAFSEFPNWQDGGHGAQSYIAPADDDTQRRRRLEEIRQRHQARIAEQTRREAPEEFDDY